ncbi:MAG: MmcQ/YjbR family DNA-binding protein [Saprospiraceae bacterium]|nr:MmcQ/YjbR family DNA-binding protein [Saprospiraceae bacterium]
MMTTDSFRSLALSFPGVVEQPHFERTAFKVSGKKIFATLLESGRTVNALLSIEEQATFCQYQPEAIYTVPNSYGLKGWTTFELDHLDEPLVAEALYCAYQYVMNTPLKKK